MSFQKQYPTFSHFQKISLYLCLGNEAKNILKDFQSEKFIFDSLVVYYCCKSLFSWVFFHYV